MDLCKYRDILGKAPRAGSPRLFNIAIPDTLAVLIVAYLITYYLYGNDFIKFLYIFALLIIIGIIFHRLFCVNTTINVAIFGKIN